MAEMLRLENVHKAFDQTEVLHGIDLTVAKGEVVAVLGPSGSGKTTLLRCANFLERADVGTLTLAGETIDLAHATRRQIAAVRKRTGFVFQGYNLFRNRTVLGNVTEGVDLGGIVEGAQDAIGGIAENVDLGSIAEGASGLVEGAQEGLGGVLEGIFGGDKE